VLKEYPSIVILVASVDGYLYSLHKFIFDILLKNYLCLRLLFSLLIHLINLLCLLNYPLNISLLGYGSQIKYRRYYSY